MHKHGLKRGTGDSATVSIHVRDLAQLFNSLDPSPFWDRDLDRDAATFIEEEFAEKRGASVWHLNVHVHEGASLANDLEKAIKNYYTRLANSMKGELRENQRLGRLGLLIGIAFFVLSIGVRQLLQGTIQTVPRAIDEGLIILAWIALWRPAEAVAYEWMPLYRRRRLYQKLAAMRVAVRSDPLPSSAAPLPAMAGP